MVIVHSDAQPKIILFGGEACIRTDGGYPKLSDVYEGSPREPSGTLVWRALTGPPGETNNAEVVVGEADVVKPDGPVPMAFHAACAASVRDEEAIVVHGGMNQSSELLGDLWALFPRSRPGDTSHAHGDDNSETFSWERLHPEGEGSVNDFLPHPRGSLDYFCMCGTQVSVQAPESKSDPHSSQPASCSRFLRAVSVPRCLLKHTTRRWYCCCDDISFLPSTELTAFAVLTVYYSLTIITPTRA